jgi:DNA-binding transcriptional regulator GbsR (MarR family)
MSDLQLSPVARKFILHWGEMGSRWGINRTVAQVQALLYLSPDPLRADQVASVLGVARSNVSTSLRELLSWGLIRVVPVLGDRNSYYESLTEVWEMFRIILAERKRREIDPILRVLRECSAEAGTSASEGDVLPDRIGEMLAFFEGVTNGYEELARVPPSALRKLVTARGRLRKLLGG